MCVSGLNDNIYVGYKNVRDERRLICGIVQREYEFAYVTWDYHVHNQVNVATYLVKHGKQNYIDYLLVCRSCHANLHAPICYHIKLAQSNGDAVFI